MRILTIGGAALAALLAGPAWSQDRLPPLREPIFKSCGGWCHIGPAGPYTPERAQRMGVPGSVTLECLLRRQGELSDCRVVEEQPSDMSFGDAALMMARRKYMTAEPRIVDGIATEERVRIVVEFPMKRAPRRLKAN